MDTTAGTLVTYKMYIDGQWVDCRLRPAFRKLTIRSPASRGR